MRLFPSSRAVAIALLVLWSGNPLRGAEKDKTAPDKGVMHKIDARVTYSSATTAGANVLAERHPGFFKVPAGHVARNFKYYFVDPKSGIERDKLNDHTIYCETTKSWVEIPADSATLELPPGDYKFVIGGTPGASGTLTLATMPTTVTKPSIGPPGPTKKRHPSPPKRTATDNDDVHGTVTTVSGGTARKKVVVDFFEIQVKLDAWLTMDGNKLTLDFIVPGLKDQYHVVENAKRWEGSCDEEAKGTKVSGKTNYESSTRYKHGQVSRLKMKGTFTARLEGNVLTGCSEERTEVADGCVGPGDIKVRWRIEDFAK